MRRIAAVCLSLACLLLLSLSVTAAQGTLSSQPAWIKGVGGTEHIEHTPDNSHLALATTTGLYLLNAEAPDALPIKLEGHTDSVRDIVFTPDSSLMATSSFDGTVRLWQMPTGNPVWNVFISDPCCPSEPPNHLTLTDDASLLLVTTGLQYSADLFVINVHSGKVQRIPSNMFPRTATIRGNDVFYINQGQGGFKVLRLHAADFDITQSDAAMINDPQVVEKSTGNSSTLFTQDYAAATSDQGVLSSVNLKDGSQGKSVEHFPLLTANYENTVWGTTKDTLSAANLETGERVDVPFTGFLGDQSGRWLAYNDAENTNILDLKTLKHMVAMPLPPASDNQSPVYNRDTGVLVYPHDHQLMVFNAETGKTVALEGASLPDNPRALYTHVLDNKIVVAYGLAESYIGIWDSTTGAPIVPVKQYASISFYNVLSDGSRLAISAEALDQGSGILAFDLQAAQIHFYPVKAQGYLSFFFDNKVILDSDSPTLVNLTTQEEKVFNIERFSATDFAFSPDSKLLATNGIGNSIRLLDVNSGAQTAVISLPESPSRMAYGERGIAVIYGKNHLQFLNVPPSATPTHPMDEMAEIYDVDIAGNTIAAAGAGYVRLFRVDAAGNLTGLMTLTSSTSVEGARQYDLVAIGARYIAAASAPNPYSRSNSYVDLWSVSTGKFVRRLDAPPGGYAFDLSFSSDGNFMALTEPGDTLVWNLARTLDEPLYITTDGSDSGHAFVDNKLAIVKQTTLTHTVDFLNLTDGSSLGTLERTLHSDGGGGGGNYRIPLEASPDGAHLIMADALGELVMWNVPAIPNTVTDNSAGIFAYCDTLPDKPVTPTVDQPVNLMWSWFATDLQYVFDHLYNANYEIKLDGSVPLPKYLMMTSVIRRDPTNNNHWTVYYKANVGKLPAGEHKVSYRLTWRSRISDGLDAYGPNSNHLEDTGSCTFTVK